MNQDFQVVQPPNDSVSKLCFSPTQNLLAASSWDNYLRIWEVNKSGQSNGKLGFQHPAPVLTCCWSNVRQIFFFACNKNLEKNFGKIGEMGH